MLGYGPISRGPVSALSSAVSLGSSAVLVATATARMDVNRRMYAATRELITDSGDVPANQPYRGTLLKPMTFDRSILNGPRLGQLTTGWGEMEIINASGEYDDVVAKYAVDGRALVLKLGVEGLDHSRYITIFRGTMEDWELDESVLRIKVRDNSYRLAVPAQRRVYGGTGGLDGTAEIKGKRHPLALGACANITPVLVIPTTRMYQFSSGQNQAVDAVYDGAVALTPTTDYATGAALLAVSTGDPGSGATIERGKYGTCLAEGYVRLGGEPQGQVTCDVRGSATGGVYAQTTASVVRRLLALSTDVADPGGLVAASFTAVDVLQPAVVGYYADGSDDRTVADVVADLMNGVGGWAGMRSSGKFEVGIFTAPTGTPAAYYSRTEVLEPGVQRVRLPDGLSPPPWRFRVAWGRNYTVQTDVEGRSGMTADRVAYLKEARRLSTSSATYGRRIMVDHPLAKDPDPVESFFRDESAATAEADRLLNLYGPVNSLYRFKVRERPFSHEVGEVVQLTYPRWDLTNGRLLRVVSVSDNTDDNTVEMVGFG